MALRTLSRICAEPTGITATVSYLSSFHAAAWRADAHAIEYVLFDGRQSVRHYAQKVRLKDDPPFP